MRPNNKRITRQRLEELVWWLQCTHIEQLTETVQLLRKQNTLLYAAMQKLKEDAGQLPKVRPYHNAYGRKEKQKADKVLCESQVEG